MRPVSVIGVGMVPFAKYRDKHLADIAWPAVKQAVEDAGIKKSEIAAAYCGTALGGIAPAAVPTEALRSVPSEALNRHKVCPQTAWEKKTG